MNNITVNQSLNHSIEDKKADITQLLSELTKRTEPLTYTDCMMYGRKLSVLMDNDGWSQYYTRCLYEIPTRDLCSVWLNAIYLERPFHYFSKVTAQILKKMS